jgi:hypothetical protein
MDSSLAPIERFISRFTGPLDLRFVVQPVMAMILGIHDGIHDSREGRTRFFWNLCTPPESRTRQLKKALGCPVSPSLAKLALAIVPDHGSTLLVRLVELPPAAPNASQPRLRRTKFLDRTRAVCIRTPF